MKSFSLAARMVHVSAVLYGHGFFAPSLVTNILDNSKGLHLFYQPSNLMHYAKHLASRE